MNYANRELWYPHCIKLYMNNLLLYRHIDYDIRINEALINLCHSIVTLPKTYV